MVINLQDLLEKKASIASIVHDNKFRESMLMEATAHNAKDTVGTTSFNCSICCNSTH